MFAVNIYYAKFPTFIVIESAADLIIFVMKTYNADIQFWKVYAITALTVHY